MPGFMNKQREKHITGSNEGDAGDVDKGKGQHHAPSIHIHSHSKGMTVHTMHHDGQHSKQEFKKGDHEAVADHVANELGGEPSETSRDGMNEGPKAGMIPGLD